MHKILDLFSGIGGFSLGLERTKGFKTAAFCEIDMECQQVLDKHWPDVPIYSDIKELTHERLSDDRIEPTVITGGFPCTDLSKAKRGAEGILGERSGLWSEMFRLIRDVRPTWVLIENVPALRVKGFTLVLQNLSEIGYCAEWHCIPASRFGAYHQRDRLWIVAYPSGIRMEGNRPARKQVPLLPFKEALSRCCGSGEGGPNWETIAPVDRMADGIPNRIHRLRVLGNSLVPLIPQMIGEAILEWEKEYAVV